MARQKQRKQTERKLERGSAQFPTPEAIRGVGGWSEYKLSAQGFLGSLGWTNVSYGWSLVFTATINQS